MKKLTIALAALSTVFSGMALAAGSDVNVNVVTWGNTAKVSVTENGQPAVNYPVTVKGVYTDQNATSSDGELQVFNPDSSPVTVKFIVPDGQGQQIVVKRFLVGDKRQ